MVVFIEFHLYRSSAMGMIMILRKVSEPQLQQLLAEPDLILDLVDELAPAGQELDLDKAWHGLHFMLTGSGWEGPEELAYLMDGGQVIGNEEEHSVGLGPARGLTNAEVSQFAAALGRLSESEFRLRYDSAAMDELEIYPVGWSKEEKPEETVDWLVTSFNELKQFVGDAAIAKQGLLVCI
ncbi:YfbM family protein [Hymenobacter cellulosivorans]|uniref:YfbM family protein n=1 Tax=Hymenobacter cellulosivorans TaxID=2932249 RepID=A0ABY4FAL6_9BACT|nr:YfbM family protein [Hymenobacter cellulosivorans]UOQ53221.1 YfbM family protein [Hymenobacter cellulosivorans]